VPSLKAVRNHVSAVLAKLGVSTRAEAVVKARQAGPGGQAGQALSMTAATAASRSGSTPDDL
jgi:hypothetical protein